MKKEFIVTRNMEACWRYLYPLKPIERNSWRYMESILKEARRQHESLKSRVESCKTEDQSEQCHSILYLQKNLPLLRDHLYSVNEDSLPYMPRHVRCEIQQLYFLARFAFDDFKTWYQELTGMNAKMLSLSLHRSLDTVDSLLKGKYEKVERFNINKFQLN